MSQNNYLDLITSCEQTHPVFAPAVAKAAIQAEASRAEDSGVTIPLVDLLRKKIRNSIECWGQL